MCELRHVKPMFFRELRHLDHPNWGLPDKHPPRTLTPWKTPVLDKPQVSVETTR
jgi:hypothetical protein